MIRQDIYMPLVLQGLVKFDIFVLMPQPDLDKIWIFRITHIDNLRYALLKGLFSYQHACADPNYINIGDSNLIQQRHDHLVKINPPNGHLGDYVPFYFGPLSPMLLKYKDWSEKYYTASPERYCVSLLQCKGHSC